MAEWGALKVWWAPQGHLKCLEVAGPGTDPAMGHARLFCAKNLFLVCPCMDGEDRAWIQAPDQLLTCFLGVSLVSKHSGNFRGEGAAVLGLSCSLQLAVPGWERGVSAS